jgi:hypothetical protein
VFSNPLRCYTYVAILGKRSQKKAERFYLECTFPLYVCRPYLSTFPALLIGLSRIASSFLMLLLALQDEGGSKGGVKGVKWIYADPWVGANQAVSAALIIRYTFPRNRHTKGRRCTD